MTRLLKSGLALSLPWWGRLPLVWLVVAVACPEQLPSQQQVTLQGGQSVVVRAAPLPKAVHDTAWCSAGVCRPFPPTAHDTTPPVPTAKGIGIGPFNGTPGSLGTLFINANSPGGLKSSLAAAEAGRYSILAAPAGGKHALLMTNGRFDLTKWKARIDAFRKDSLTWKAAGKKGTLTGVGLLDEAQCSSCWGGQAVPFSTVGQMACYAKSVFPGVALFSRSNPRHIPAGIPCLDGAMQQFDASMGSVTVWGAAELQSALDKHLVKTGGVNYDNGGKVVAGCIKSETRVGRCSMSAVELSVNLRRLVSDTLSCGATVWGPNAARWQTYTAIPAIRDTVKSLAAWMKTRPRPKRCGG